LRAAEDDDIEPATVLFCEDADTAFGVGNDDGDSDRDLRAAETESGTVLTCDDTNTEEVTEIDAKTEGLDDGVRSDGEGDTEDNDGPIQHSFVFVSQKTPAHG